MSEQSASPGQTAEWVSDSAGFEWAVRVGLACYGLVHLLIAWLALSLVFGDRSGSPDQQGALNQIAQTPLGVFVLWAAAVGFVALAAWQALEAWRGARHDRGAADQARKRLTAVARAIVYTAFALSSARVAIGDRSSTDVDHVTRELMRLPLGQAIVVVVGLVIVAVGVGHGVAGVTKSFTKHLKRSATGDSGRVVVVVGQVGYIAKGIAFCVVGALFVWAAVTFDPAKAGGLDVALRTLLDQAYGGWLLGVVAVGIGCFGVYCLAWARDVDPSE